MRDSPRVPLATSCGVLAVVAGVVPHPHLTLTFPSLVGAGAADDSPRATLRVTHRHLGVEAHPQRAVEARNRPVHQPNLGSPVLVDERSAGAEGRVPDSGPVKDFARWDVRPCLDQDRFRLAARSRLARARRRDGRIAIIIAVPSAAPGEGDRCAGQRRDKPSSLTRFSEIRPDTAHDVPVAIRPTHRRRTGPCAERYARAGGRHSQTSHWPMPRGLGVTARIGGQIRARSRAHYAACPVGRSARYLRQMRTLRGQQGPPTSPTPARA